MTDSLAGAAYPGRASVLGDLAKMTWEAARQAIQPVHLAGSDAGSRILYPSSTTPDTKDLPS
jgi:hypothetical protein